MAKDPKAKIQKQVRAANVLESLKDIGQEAGTDFFKQFFSPLPEKKYSGNLTPGESLQISDVYSGKLEENQKLKKQISFERRLREEEKSLMQKKSNELKLELQAVSQEVVSLATATQSLGEEVQIAAMQAPAEPGPYHLIFFEKLLEFIKSFRKKIESASVWLTATNKKAEKKNFWNMYKKKAGSFLLAPDHYLQRSAG